MPDFTPHQQKIIKRYYNSRDEIMLTKLAELVTELYLAEGAKKLDRLWERAETAMKNLKWPPTLIEHIMQQRKPETLAKNLQERMGKPG